jgi:hypothetical protein
VEPEGTDPARNVAARIPGLDAAQARFHSPSCLAAPACAKGAARRDLVVVEMIRAGVCSRLRACRNTFMLTLQAAFSPNDDTCRLGNPSRAGFRENG